MKKMFSFLFVTALITFSACAQQPKPSPAVKAEGKAGAATITVNYGQPSMKGRKVFGELVPYGKVWRTGANEATTFETDRDILVEGKKLAKGKYGLFTIPGEHHWTFIFSKNWNQWGSYRYKEDEDVLRVDVMPYKLEAPVEKMTLDVKDSKLRFMWENTGVNVNIK